MSSFLTSHNGFTGATLVLSVNSFTGSFPEAAGAMATTRSFGIHVNGFTGTFPESFCSLSAVVLFGMHNNNFTGTLPDRGMRAMMAVRFFFVSTNRFTGMLPDASMRAVAYLALDVNSFAGTLPDSGIRGMTALTNFEVSENHFAGALPGRGLRVMTKVAYFGIFKNGFIGALPDSGLRVMSAVDTFGIGQNSFAGVLPESGLQAMRAVEDFGLGQNSFTGVLPDCMRAMMAISSLAVGTNRFAGMLPGSIGAMMAVTSLAIYTNRFTGTLPDAGMNAVGSLTFIAIYRNRFTGMLPEGGIRAMSTVEYFGLCNNRFTGTLPAAMRAMLAVTTLTIAENSFRGALPDRGIRAMMAVAAFSIFENGFTGKLPDDGIRGMRALLGLYVDENDFTGVLPDGFLPAAYETLFLSSNYFEGEIPAIHARAVLLSHNLFSGTIPQHLFHGWDPVFQWVVADGMLLEGSIPHSVRRLTTVIIVSLGHGLTGMLPAIPGTVALLSLWENALEGYLPELHIMNSSVLFVNGNDFSCKLPRYRDKSLSHNASLALTGNRFAKPRHPPPWIRTMEQPTDMFCVSNKQGKNFVMLLLCGACVLCLVACRLKTNAHSLHGRLARARLAWCETSQQHYLLLMASFVLLPLYSDLQSWRCTVVTDHLRFHVIDVAQPGTLCLVACVHMWIWQFAACFHERHALRMIDPCDVPQLRRNTSRFLAGTRVHWLWFLACILASAPGVLYSAVKAVPGFLQVTGFWRWIVNNTVALVSGAVTSSGLEGLAGQLGGAENDSATLQLIGLVLASILLPGLVTILCHSECLGAWTFFWAPCRKTWPYHDGFNVDKRRTSKALGLDMILDVLSKRDICRIRWWHMDGKECADAVIEHLMWLLYSKFAQHCFTMAAFKILSAQLRGKRMKLQAANVLLKYMWLVLKLFGPCLPILNVLISLLAKTYSVLLFGLDLKLLEIEDSR